MNDRAALPPVVIEQTRVERSDGPSGATTRNRASTVDVRPHGYELVTRALAVAAMVRDDYLRTIGVYREFRPRRQSHVQHRIGRGADETLSAVCRRDELRVDLGPLRLTCDATHVVYDARGHEYRLAGRLHLPLSWPQLPMVLSVGEISSNECALGLSLRSRRRIRYPLRYFHTVHALLTRLEAVLPGPA